MLVGLTFIALSELSSFFVKSSIVDVWLAFECAFAPNAHFKDFCEENWTKDEKENWMVWNSATGH